jgi:putative transposase
VSQNAAQRKQHIDKATSLSVVKQCELLEVHRSGLYYQPIPETAFNLELMQVIDEKHMLHPWLGVPRMTQWLRRDKDYMVNHKRQRSKKCWSKLSRGV